MLTRCQGEGPVAAERVWDLGTEMGDQLLHILGGRKCRQNMKKAMREVLLSHKDKSLEEEFGKQFMNIELCHYNFSTKVSMFHRNAR